MVIRDVNLRFRARKEETGGGSGGRIAESLRDIVRALLPRHAPTFFPVVCPLSGEVVDGRGEEKSKAFVRRAPWRRRPLLI